MPTPLEKEILAEFDERFSAEWWKGFGATYDIDRFGIRGIRDFLSSSLTRQRESFLTMLPPEKEYKATVKHDEFGESKGYEYYNKSQVKGWNDYRHALLAKMNKHE